MKVKTYTASPELKRLKITRRSFEYLILKMAKQILSECIELTPEQYREINNIYPNKLKDISDFRYQQIINEAIYDIKYEWIKEEHKLSDLWRSVAIQNSTINNEPYEVADKVIEAFQKQFNLK